MLFKVAGTAGTRVSSIIHVWTRTPSNKCAHLASTAAAAAADDLASNFVPYRLIRWRQSDDETRQGGLGNNLFLIKARATSSSYRRGDVVGEDNAVGIVDCFQQGRRET